MTLCGDYHTESEYGLFQKLLRDTYHRRVSFDLMQYPLQGWES
ncbi:hypothetical protein Xmir_03193 [Xenorhabdus miraniensis]|uniref:Uncharacterized protein n=1 Tax=Xenorhabdus miraniensis TaxID=351674 RepID=A0A2D0JMC6_9GAMM|nr:hypothetical protein Xmir_03193 [Xenorhabdus miraniensis]